MKKNPTLLKNTNGWQYASLPLNLARKTMQVALLLSLIIGAGSASAATITTAGAETSFGNQSFPNPATTWGATSGTGQKADFRSTDTQPKLFVLTGAQNVYGNDGYAFYASSTTSNVSLGPLVSDPTYVSNISLTGTNGGIQTQTAVTGGFGYMDNPTLAAGAYATSNTILAGELQTHSLISDGATDDVLTFTLSQSKTFRFGIMTVGGDSRKPLSLTLSSGATTDTIAATGLSGGSGGYVNEDWYFFDVTGTAGEVFTLSLQQNPFNGGNSAVTFSGVTFDSVPEPSTYALLGIGLAILAIGIRRKSLSTDSQD